MPRQFIGRTSELASLQNLTRKDAASLVVVTGRRRIGKSRLIEEFASRNGAYRALFLAALAPQKGIGGAAQRESIARQIELALAIDGLPRDSWLALFTNLAEVTARGRWILLLDELSWMAAGDLRFLSEFKIVWDQGFSRNPHLILFLCGSVSSWLERNILSNTGFVGRVSSSMRVEELPIADCNQFWGTRTVSDYDRLKVLGVTGGVPRYLEEVIPADSADSNIRRLCFEPEGMLFREFDQIFPDLFQRKVATYRQIVEAVSDGHRTANEIREAVQRDKGGVISKYLDDLVLAGFLARDFTWNVASRSAAKLSRYRLRDNYLRFYLRHILPRRRQIERRQVSDAPLTTLPAWDSILGLQFENLVLQNRRQIWQALGIPAADIEFDGPFFQTATRRRQGCQIDYLIHTRTGVIYVCEVKLSRNPLGLELEAEVAQKIERLRLPKHCSTLPVLIHANDLREGLQYSRYFANIIDFRQFLH